MDGYGCFLAVVSTYYTHAYIHGSVLYAVGWLAPFLRFAGYIMSVLVDLFFRAHIPWYYLDLLAACYIDFCDRVGYTTYALFSTRSS